MRRAVADRGATFGWRASTLARLAAERGRTELATRGLCPVGRLACEAVVARVVQAHTAAGRIGRYATVAGTPGFIRALTGTFLELRLDGLPVDRVAAAGPGLADLQEAYESELERTQLADWPAVLRAAIAAAPESHRPVSLLLLDVPIRSSSEARFVATIGIDAPTIFATVLKWDERTARRLREALRLSEDTVEPAPGKCAPEELRAHLFEDHGPGQARQDDTVTILPAPGENRECVESARCILRFADHGTRSDEMAILLRFPDEYRPHVQEALARAEIPAYFPRGVVRPDPTGRAFLAALRCAQDGVSARRFAEYLSLGQVPNAGPRGQPPTPEFPVDRWVAPDQEFVSRAVEAATSVLPEEAREESVREDGESEPVVAGTLRAPRRWERLMVDAAVIGGIDRWRRHLDGLARQMQQALQNVDDEGETGT